MRSPLKTMLLSPNSKTPKENQRDIVLHGFLFASFVGVLLYLAW
jgi:hypothetical protein